MIAILVFLGRTLDQLVTVIAVRRGYLESNPIANLFIGNDYYFGLINIGISLSFYAIYEKFGSNKVVRDIIYFLIASNFIVAFYGVGILLFT